jgi:hypothetical protein
VLVDASVIATVQGLDAGGTAVADLTPYSTFTSDRAADIVDVDEITFPQVGTSVITGSYGSLAATDSVAVTAGPVASLVVTTSASLVTENDSVTVTVMGYDAHGNPIGDVTSAATISSSVASDAIANPVVTFAFDAGNAATTPLGHVLTASLGAATGSATVTVEPLVHSITMHLSSSTATVGDTIAVTVEAFDVNGDPVGDISTDVVVTSDQPDLVSGNTVTFTHASPHRITATYGTLSASGIVQVSPALARLAATGAAVLPLLSAPLALLTLGGALLVLRRRRTSGI